MPTHALIPRTPKGIAMITAQMARVAKPCRCEEPMTMAKAKQIGAASTQSARLLAYRKR
jgi:hypothetical protein